MADRLLWRVAVGAAVLLAAVGCSKTRPAEAKASPTARAPAEQPPPKVEFPTAEGARDAAVAEIVRRLQAVGPGRVEPVKGPWADARAGQYAVYRGRGGITMTRRVVAVDADSVTLEIATTRGDKTFTQRQRMPRRVGPGQGLDSIPGTADWAEETLTVAGREINCRVVTWRKMVRDRTRTCKVWLSDRVAGRLVRSGRVDKDGQLDIILDLVEFGERAGS
jgi:hypothetical protein